MDRVKKATMPDVQMKDLKAQAEKREQEVLLRLEKFLAAAKKSKRFMICISIMDEKENANGELQFQSSYERFQFPLEDAKMAMKEFIGMFDKDLRD